MFKTLSIVISVYNEEKYLKKILDKVIASNSLGLKKDVIVINDGSTDRSERVIKEQIVKLAKKNINVNFNLLKNKKNKGKGAALKQGFISSKGDIVLVQDADLEYDPNDYPVLLVPFLQQNADVVYGSRFISAKPHRVLYFWHYLGNMLITTLSNMLTNLNLTDIETGYKIFKGELIRKIAPSLQSKRFGFEPEITARIAKIKNLKIYEVGISYFGRTYEEGKKIGWKDGVKAIWEIIKYNLFT
ncbi:glycosyl transferase [Candidatus Roizmanbacteria bacterium RIFCSPHIGHO2_01_FULL_39_12c]|uniref:Glycosyl transferase n=1 Tax=Candidatus Roizmanbacteria bacterium RIFCSPHIGHO2_01_FULL_39_12c TaxID=1802031 RepID=A0A1F7G8E6_9BACT|nr:MAG: glycosyl transferase [Candidatus Roizmanbacteria bacterium RIFCSPHIGHO2_01_FULL_39_12c]OGK46581.1 MAG: glycosyl transferase [Candidatus Roizmanbacteria bacterium RIFCSPLOWO2_01_FULL_40_13]